MITLQEAIDIATELESSVPVESRRKWPATRQVAAMMDFYNANRKELKATTPAEYKEGGIMLIPYSINCRPCIGKVVQILLHQQPITSTI